MSSDFQIKMQDWFKQNASSFENIKDSKGDLVNDTTLFECTAGDEKVFN